jgi:hypothetical protein
VCSPVKHELRAGCLGGQYPGEKEITFPPFTGLEADGDPRVERTEGGGEVVVFPLKVARLFPASLVQCRGILPLLSSPNPSTLCHCA